MNTEDKIKVLVVEPRKKPYEKLIDLGLKSLQKEVGGYIEATYPFEAPIALLCNEEGKLNGLELNRALRDDDGHIYDVVAGTFLLVGLGKENFISVPDKYMKQFKEQFQIPGTVYPHGWQAVGIADGGKEAYGARKTAGAKRIYCIYSEKTTQKGGTESVTSEELNLKLYNKILDEQQAYRDYLMGQPAEEILRNAYELAIREDILLSFEYNDFTDEQAEALLASETPLADIFRQFEQIESDHMELVRSCIETRANDLIEDTRDALRNLPVYTHAAAYAREHDEIEQYRQSHRTNVQCKDAIEEAIAEHYLDNRLDPKGAREVLEKFGAARTCYVLANTIRHKDWDGRISDKHKEWAKTFSFPADTSAWGGDRSHEFVVGRSHPGLIDLFVSQVRKELEQAKNRKPPIIVRLSEMRSEKTPKLHTFQKEDVR